MNVSMNTHRRIMHMANCSLLRPHLRAAPTPTWPLTSAAVCVLSSPLHWRCISSLSAARSPQELGYKALHRPSGPRLASIPRGSRNNSTSHRYLPSTLSFDQFSEQALTEPTGTPQVDDTRKAPSQKSSSVCPPTTKPSLLLLRLFEDLVPRGLLPRVTAEPPSSTHAGNERVWAVTISLHELGIDVEGRGPTILSAEIAAAAQFDLALSRAGIVAQLSSWPQTRLSVEDAKNIVQSYWQFAHASRGALRFVVTKLDSGAFEARTFAGTTPIGEPVISGFKHSASRIQSLALAHAITNGHPDLWPMSPGNPFQAKIVLDRVRLEKLRHLITDATDYLRTTPGQVAGGKRRGAFYKVTQEGSEQNTVNVKGRSGGAPNRDIPDLQSWLAAFPFPPSRSKMLIVGASMSCLEHAVVLAAMEKHAIYRRTAVRGGSEDRFRHTGSLHVTEGDHTGLLSLFQRFRDERWIGKKQRHLSEWKKRRLSEIAHGEEHSSQLHKNAQDQADDEEKSSQLHDNAQNQAKDDTILDNQGFEVLFKNSPKLLLKNSPESAGASSTKNATVGWHFDHYDPDGIASVSTSAGTIERFMITAGLVSYQKEISYVSLPGSELKIRAEPYGGDLSRTAHRRPILRHLLVLGFSKNIAQIGHGTLVPGHPPQLRIDSQQVHVDSPLKAHMPQKQLYKNLRAGPMVVVTGMTNNPQDSRLTARYCTPISTWEAVLLGENLTRPGDKETPVAGAVQVLVNNWLPVLVKSEVEGVSHEEIRDTLFEAREALHRAIDKAMFDYVKYSWQSSDFYELLAGLPNEDSLEAMAVPQESRSQHQRHRPTRKDE